MALKAGYKGFKKVGSGLSYDNTTGELNATGGSSQVIANPEGEATESLTKLEVDETIYSLPSAYELPTASDTVLGGVKVGSGLAINDGVLSNNYSLPTASDAVLGGVKVGSGLAINDGVLSNNYELPTASNNVLGGVKVGSGLTISDGVLSVTGGGGGGNYSETVLANQSTAQSEYTLSDSIANYDALRFGISYGSSDGALELTGDVGASYFMTNFPYVASPSNSSPHMFIRTLDGYIRILMGNANNKIKVFSPSGSGYIEKIIGIKF